jgi:drug/metabolite transporter (DMT)-like permease
VQITIVAWASAFAGIRAGLQAYAPEQVALLRYLTASVALLIVAVLTKMPLPHRQDIPAIAGLGLVGFSIYNLALNKGEHETPAAVASVIIASAPIFVSLFARFVLHERLTSWAWIGIAVCFSGVTVIAFSAGSGLALSPSALLILIAAVGQALYTTFQKPLLRRYSPLQFTTYAIWAGTFCLLPFLPGLIGQMGIVPGALGYVCWAYVLSRLTASRAGAFLYAVPLRQPGSRGCGWAKFRLCLRS